MSKLVWDKTSERLYETGVRQVVCYPQSEQGTYSLGVAWNGVSSITESPSGADPNDIFADDTKYLSIRSREEFGGTIEAYTYPDEFAVCDGSAEVVEGVMIGQQTRKPFGLSYRTAIGNDVAYDDYGYKLHLIYNATVSPSDRQYQTINDSPEAISFSWEYTTIPVDVEGYKPTSRLTIDSTQVNKEKLKQLEDMLYGTTDKEPYLPLPADVFALFTTGE